MEKHGEDHALHDQDADHEGAIKARSFDSPLGPLMILLAVIADVHADPICSKRAKIKPQ
jgi:hypothetical protein